MATKRVCVAEGCALAGTRRGALCDTHYRRKWANGAPPPRVIVCVECGSAREVGARGRLPRLCENCERTKKWCPGCESVRPHADFSKSRGSRLGLYTHCKPCHASKIRGRIYGLTSSDVDEMERRQGGGCAICGDPLSIDLNIDHCHTTGAVRGLLCGPCNRGLGCFLDDPGRVRSALGYLLEHAEAAARA